MVEEDEPRPQIRIGSGDKKPQKQCNFDALLQSPLNLEFYPGELANCFR